MVGLNLYRGCPRNINSNFYGVCPHTFSRADFYNLNGLYLDIRHCFYGVSL